MIKFIVIEPVQIRPVTKLEKIGLINQVYEWNNWEESEQKVNCEMLGLPFFVNLARYSETELDLLLADFERCKMIKY